MSKMGALSAATFVSSWPNENKLSHGCGRLKWQKAGLHRTANFVEVRRYLILSDTLYQFHSQVLPLSGEKAWLHTGRSLSLASQRNMTIIFFPLKVSFAKKCPTPFSNEPTTGGSSTPTLLATQYRLQNLVFGLKSRSVTLRSVSPLTGHLAGRV